MTKVEKVAFEEGRVSKIGNLEVTLIEIVVKLMLVALYIADLNQLCAVGVSLLCRMGDC